MNALMAAFFLAAPAHAQLLELPASVGIDPIEVEAILRVELSGRALDDFRFAVLPAPDGAIVLSAISNRSESRSMSLTDVEPHARARLLALMLVELARLASAPIDETVSAIPPPPPAGASAPADPGRPAETSETLEAPSPEGPRQAVDDEIPGRLGAPSDEGESPMRLDLELGLRAFFRDLTAAPLLAAGIDIANAVAVGARVLGFAYSNDVGAVTLVQATVWTSVRLFVVDFGARFGLLLRGELGYAHAFGRSDTPGIVASDYGSFTAGSSIAPELTWNVDSVQLRFVVDVGFQYGIAPTAVGQVAASFHGFYLGPALGLRFDL